MIPAVYITGEDEAGEILLRTPRRDPGEMVASDFSSVLSIYDMGGAPPFGLQFFTGHKLELMFDDCLDTRFGFVPADECDAAKIVAFAKGVRTDGRALIHCAKGWSRSPAAAMAIPAVRLRPSHDNAQAICSWLTAVRPPASPNLHVVGMIDHLTGWDGMLVGAAQRRFSR